MSVLVGLVIFYFALMIFPWMLKAFGLGFVADPLIKLINWLLLASAGTASLSQLLRRHPVQRGPPRVSTGKRRVRSTEANVISRNPRQ